MFISSLCFLLGACSLQLFNTIPSHFWLMLINFTILILILINKKLIRVNTSYVTIFLLGFNWCCLHAEYEINHRLSLKKDGQKLLSNVTIIEPPYQNKKTYEFLASFTNKNLNPVKLKWYKPPRDLQVGDKWQFYVKLKTPHNYANPGNFDKEKYFFY